MAEIQRLQKQIFHEYSRGLGLGTNAKYIYGTPLRPVVPLDTGTGGLFIIGAYPSARFEIIDGVSDVPVADNAGPFEYERWFDGSRVRRQPSAKELEELFLGPLSIERQDCWITDLVKVFLFKKGHIDRYNKLNASAPEGYIRERFAELGEKSLTWLEKELLVAKPNFVITLGAEVAGILRGIRSQPAQIRLLVPETSMLVIGKASVPVMHCAHPGILMRKDSRNPWPAMHREGFIPALKLAMKNHCF
jgi:uracil-DNA glycosylase